MSYILDALRKAEAERQQGKVPGLHQNSDPLTDQAEQGARKRTPHWALVLTPVLMALAAGAGWWLSRPAPPAATQPVAQQAPVPAPVQVPAPAPMPTVVSAPVPPPPAPVAAPAQVPPPASSASNAALRFTQLSPEQQRAMPAVVPGGSVWSKNVDSRFVILNGQVVREGDIVAPDLVLERIQPKSAILRWRGLLIELPL
jgi:general secretion pathway protein B